MPYKPRAKVCEYCRRTFLDRSGKNRQRFCSIRCASWGKEKPAKVPKRRRGTFKVCPICNSKFWVKRSVLERTKYCSRPCKGIASRQPKKRCEICHTLFQPAYNTSKRFCSSKCKYEARRTGEWRNCEECNTRFYVPRYRLKNGDGRFCSIQCHNLVLNRYNAIRGTFVSKPEKTFKRLLDNEGIYYIHQATIDNLVCDFLIPDCRLVIEVDGDYWHGNPEQFPDLSQQQSEQQERDKRRDWFLRRHGFSVLRIWVSELESDIQNITAVVTQRLQRRRAYLAQNKANLVHRQSSPSEA